MNQGFKFKLDGLLKLREFKEKKIKFELGKILKKISEIEDYIVVLKENIDECYKAQEAFLDEPAAGQMIQFFPQYIHVKRQEVISQEKILGLEKKNYQSKIAELASAKGEVKILGNLKEKKNDEYRREIEKKWQQNIDEIIQMRTARAKYLEKKEKA